MARSASRPPASREEIIDAARRMVVADGVDALSMRKLAAELGLAPTAIYWHVGDRVELLHAVFESMLADLPDVRASGRTPKARIASVARAIRSQVVADRTLTALAHALNRSGEVAFPAQVVLAREVTAAGVQGKPAEQLVRSILFTIGGLALLEHAFTEEPSTTPSRWAQLHDPAIDLGLLKAMRAPADLDALFEHTLDALLTAALTP
jgi:AcrR family transcriptional regulator